MEQTAQKTKNGALSCKRNQENHTEVTSRNKTDVSRTRRRRSMRERSRLELYPESGSSFVGCGRFPECSLVPQGFFSSWLKFGCFAGRQHAQKYEHFLVDVSPTQSAVVEGQPRVPHAGPLPPMMQIDEGQCYNQNRHPSECGRLVCFCFLSVMYDIFGSENVVVWRTGMFADQQDCQASVGSKCFALQASSHARRLSRQSRCSLCPGSSLDQGNCFPPVGALTGIRAARARSRVYLSHGGVSGT